MQPIKDVDPPIYTRSPNYTVNACTCMHIHVHWSLESVHTCRSCVYDHVLRVPLYRVLQCSMQCEQSPQRTCSSLPIFWWFERVLSLWCIEEDEILQPDQLTGCCRDDYDHMVELQTTELAEGHAAFEDVLLDIQHRSSYYNVAYPISVNKFKMSFSTLCLM